MMVDVSAREAITEATLGRAHDPSPSAPARPVLASTDLRIDRYLVLDEIGRGGMGRVLRAYDPTLQREVALKVMRPRSLSDGARERLIREARAMARLNHPNVVEIYDTTSSPEHGLVLAMEYVEGPCATAWLEAESRPVAEVVDTFVRAGRGLVAAHEVGLLHRDFKPSNVLRASGPGGTTVVKVTDFGLALVVGSTATSSSPAGDVGGDDSQDLTRDGTVVGTPAYMAPEQHRGLPLGPSSDQYSLCIALWQALTGALPFSGPDLARMKLKGPPPWPSQIAVPRRLAAALRRGLAPDPAARWPHLDALLAELTRVARPTSASPPIVLGVVTLGAAVAFVVGRTHDDAAPCADAARQLEGIWDAPRRAEAADAVLAKAPPHASTAWDQVERRLDAYAEEWVAEHTTACSATAIAKTQPAAELDLRMSCLQRAKTSLAATVTVLADADEALLRNASRVLGGLPALAQCGDLDALRREVPPPSGDEATTVEVLRERIADARALGLGGRYDAAATALEGVREQLAAVHYEPVRTQWLVTLGEVRAKEGEYDEAVETLRAAARLAAQHGQWFEMLQATAELSFITGVKQTRFDPGFAHARVGLGLARRFANPRALLTVRNAIAAMHHARDELPEAEREYREAGRVALEHLGEHAPMTLTIRSNLAAVLFARGQLGEAERELLAVQRGVKATFGPDHPKVSQSHNNVAAIHYERRDYEGAAQQLRAALTIDEKRHGPHHPQVAFVRRNLAAALLKLGDHEESLTQAQAAVKDLRAALGDDHPEVGHAQMATADALHALRRLDEAEALLRETLELFERAVGPDHTDTGLILHTLAAVVLAQKRPDESVAIHRDALARWVRGRGDDHPQVARSRTMLGMILLDHEKAEEARALLEKAWAVRQRPDLPAALRGETAFLLAKAHDALHDGTRALELARAAEAAYVEAGPAETKALADVRAFLRRHS